MNEDMTPCPFCGSSKTWFTGYLSDGWMECGTCYAQGPPSNEYMRDEKRAESESRERWNKRKDYYNEK